MVLCAAAFLNFLTRLGGRGGRAPPCVRLLMLPRVCLAERQVSGPNSDGGAAVRQESATCFPDTGTAGPLTCGSLPTPSVAPAGVPEHTSAAISPDINNNTLADNRHAGGSVRWGTSADRAVQITAEDAAYATSPFDEASDPERLPSKASLRTPGQALGAQNGRPLRLADIDIGRVFMTASQALYGHDGSNASSSNAVQPVVGAVANMEEEDGRLYVSLEPLVPDGVTTPPAASVASAAVRSPPQPLETIVPEKADSPTEPEAGHRKREHSSEETRTTSQAATVGDRTSVEKAGARLAGDRSSVEKTARKRLREQDKPLECLRCQRRFVLPKMLARHKCGVTYNCAECGKVFKKRCQLKAHFFIHKQVKDLICATCGSAFKEKSNFNRHVRTHSALRPYKCPHCAKCFKVAATLYVHRLTHEARGRFVCDLCGKDFKRPEHLRQHRRIHTGEKPYGCSVCGQSFTTDNTLRTHMRRHTGERPYPCPICQKRFTQSSAMKTHWRRHSDQREFHCPACPLKFKQKYDLSRHMESHSTDRPHRCPLCLFCFKTRSSLQKHSETHNGTRQFRCTICDKVFRRPSYLRLHEASHSDQTRFSCPVCSKTFTRRYNLRLHQEEHEEGGGRRHGCRLCGRAFRRVSGLRQHQRSVHSRVEDAVEAANAQAKDAGAGDDYGHLGRLSCPSTIVGGVSKLEVDWYTPASLRAQDGVPSMEVEPQQPVITTFTEEPVELDLNGNIVSHGTGLPLVCQGWKPAVFNNQPRPGAPLSLQLNALGSAVTEGAVRDTGPIAVSEAETGDRADSGKDPLGPANPPNYHTETESSRNPSGGLPVKGEASDSEDVVVD